MKNKRLILILSISTLLLLIPLIAIQFTNKVNWTMSDFAVAALLLFGTGISCELVLRKIKTTRYRIVLCGVLLIILFLVWIELAVGLFRTPLFGE